MNIIDMFIKATINRMQRQRIKTKRTVDRSKYSPHQSDRERLRRRIGGFYTKRQEAA